jgi:hypothetical protein
MGASVRTCTYSWRVRRALGWQKSWILPVLAIFMKAGPVRPCGAEGRRMPGGRYEAGGLIDTTNWLLSEFGRATSDSGDVAIAFAVELAESADLAVACGAEGGDEAVGQQVPHHRVEGPVVLVIGWRGEEMRYVCVREQM